MAYTSPKGTAFVDRALYLPESWTSDRERCGKVAVPADVEFATKPELAQQMLQRAVEAGVPATWVTGDSVYGGHSGLRNWLEARPLAYVLALSPKDTLINLKHWPQRVSTWLADLPTEGWNRLSAGEGSKGPRLYDWLRLPLYDPALAGWKRWLMLRRSLSDPSKVSPYVCLPRLKPPWPNWSGWLVAVGRSKAALKAANRKSAWMNMKSAPIRAGIVISLWPVWPTLS